ncbi:atp3 gamma subunit of the F1 sector of mitochondrial F1F0 ATP synthase [Entophlyctis sp. JEL0112]|nr:atp3 gamma subunit of the F1 sector of mitochondrial F1F0 ATP synthase [Entophlyctis sp. JEL0112]
MKMIASTKVTKAQRSMETARAYGLSATISSDRGLCGGIHSSIAKAVKRDAAQSPSSAIAVIGQKARTQIQRDFRQNIFVHFDQVTKVHPVWLEAALIADEVINARAAAAPAASSSEDAAKAGALDGKIYYNRFKSVIAYEATALPIHSVEALSASPKLAAYEVDDAVLKSFEEFAFANSLFWAIAEGYASEMAAKRTAMENATKNAGEMITKLTLTYNRSRQAAITNELIDIITGASSLN